MDALLMAATPTLDPTAEVARTPAPGRVRSALALFRRGGALGRPASYLAWGFVVLVVLVAIFAPLLAPYDPTLRNEGAVLEPPFGEYLLGTDQLGRDQLSRLLYGARPIVVIPAAAALLAGVLGTLVGLVAGFFGGWVQTALMRLMDVPLSFPLILLAIMVVAALGASAVNLIVAIAISQVPIFARIVNALTQREARREYTLAAKASGFPTSRILLRELLPNVVGQTIVQGTSIIAVAAGFSTALSYLGLGIRPPTPDWGNMVRESQELLAVAPDLVIVPALLITLFVVAVNFIGDDLNTVLSRDRGAGA
jgi:peptide/nickel transport system permease protein